jgi:hypothetical protein
MSEREKISITSRPRRHNLRRPTKSAASPATSDHLDLDHRETQICERRPKFHQRPPRILDALGQRPAPPNRLESTWLRDGQVRLSFFC